MAPPPAVYTRPLPGLLPGRRSQGAVGQPGDRAGVSLAELNRLLKYDSAGNQPSDALLKLVTRVNEKMPVIDGEFWTISRFTRDGGIHFRLLNQVADESR